MQPLRRNQKTFYYAMRDSASPLYDYGGVNGQYGVLYGEPVKSCRNFAPAAGEKNTRQFGETLDYDEVLLPAPDCEADEYSVVWCGCDEPPVRNADGSFTPPWTHEVERVAGSLNNRLIALRRVDVR